MTYGLQMVHCDRYDSVAFNALTDTISFNCAQGYGLSAMSDPLCSIEWKAYSIGASSRSPLIPEAVAGKSFSAAGGFSFSLSSGKGEKKEHPVNPARPVKFEDHFTGVNPV